MKLVKIPAGSFVMGEEGLERFSSKGQSATVPLHEVEISCFYLADKEVTKEQFREYVRAKGFPWDRFPQVDPDAKLPPYPEGLDYYENAKLTAAQRYLLEFPAEDCPVGDVSWNEAVAFCEWLSEKEGRKYRLPTEAEWEYAYRAGSRTVYWWGDEYDPTMTRAGGDAAQIGGRKFFFAPVGSYPPNPWGLYDMHGNVYGWVWDYYDAGYYARSPRHNPEGPQCGVFRVTRGGGCKHGCRLSPVACRSQGRHEARRSLESPGLPHRLRRRERGEGDEVAGICGEGRPPPTQAGARPMTSLPQALLPLVPSLLGCGARPEPLPEGVRESDLPASFINTLRMQLVKIPHHNGEGLRATLEGNAPTHYHLVPYEGRHLNPVWGETPPQAP